MNKTMEELIKAGNLYGYEINVDGDSTIGIVAAVSCVDARKKVKDAYLKHGYNESELETIITMKLTSGWFADSPDVLEVCGA